MSDKKIREKGAVTPPFCFYMRLLFAFLFCFFLAVPVAAQPAAQPVKPPAQNRDLVVVLHGIFRSASSMKTFANRLAERDFEVLNVDYPSTAYTLEELTEKIHPDIDRFLKAHPGRTVHFAGYSMGGLLIRAYLAKYKPENLGRVVMMGTPNHGSEVADFLRENWAFRKFYGPAGQQLTTDQDYMSRFGKPDYPFAVIAGDRSIDPVSSKLIPGDDDGKVSIQSTHLEGEEDHIILHTDHLTMPENFAVAVEAAHYLRYGFFKRGSAAEMRHKSRALEKYNR